MHTWDVVFYATLQGISEFLPISSSAHLKLFETFFTQERFPDFMETAVHVGSLCVLLIYFYKDILHMLRGLLQTFSRYTTDDKKIFQRVFCSALPAVLLGYGLNATVGRDSFQTLPIIAWTTLLFGAFLWVADQNPQKRTIAHITPGRAFWGWGLAQCLAFVHGVSRSGICITWGRLQGYKRYDAVRFSFLMALPTLSGATLLKSVSYVKAGCPELPTLILGIGISFVVGLLTIHLLMALVRTRFLQALACYRILLGLLLLAGVYGLGWA